MVVNLCKYNYFYISLISHNWHSLQFWNVNQVTLLALKQKDMDPWTEYSQNEMMPKGAEKNCPKGDTFSICTILFYKAFKWVEFKVKLDLPSNNNENEGILLFQNLQVYKLSIVVALLSCCITDWLQVLYPWSTIRKEIRLLLNSL